MNWRKELDAAVELARGAGAIVLEHYGRVERLTKTHAAAHHEAVTQTDRDSQRHIVAGLRRLFPHDGIVGEENDTGDAITFECPDPMGRVWVIDPIDGTNNFIAGLDYFAVCIALLVKGEPVVGVVYDVTRGAIYKAACGMGAWKDDKLIETLHTPLSDQTILMLTSNLLDASGGCPRYPARWLAQTTWKIRILGSAALDAIQVAAGVAHGAVTVNGKLWDAAAPAAIVLEAGGRFTDFAGQPIFPFNLAGYGGAKVPFLAAAPQAHERLLTEIRE